MTEPSTADLVARARAEAQTVGSAFCDTLTERLLTALADALEDTAAERDLAVRERDMQSESADRWNTTATLAAKRLVQAAAERDRAHATLREIVAVGEEAHRGWDCASLARERLANP